MAVISSNHNQPSLLARHMPPLTCYNYAVITERHPSKFLAPSSRVKLLWLSRIKLIQMRHIGHFGLTASLYSTERCPLQISICQIVGKTNYTTYITSGAKAYRERQCVCVCGGGQHSLLLPRGDERGECFPCNSLLLLYILCSTLVSSDEHLAL